MQSWSIWMPTVITLLSVAYAGGALIGRIKDQETTLLKHDARIVVTENRLGDHDIAIAESKAWRAGYDAGKSSHGRTQ